jgi:antitoxin component YwqK of YwqJK toxin-antitoxin module
MTTAEENKSDVISNELPEQAVEEVTLRWENGDKREATYRIDGNAVWCRYWDESGQLGGEHGISDNKWHGPDRTWHSNGRLSSESCYYHGKEHGIACQYDEDGNLLGTYTMRHGTGLDRWYQKAGVLSEERQYQDGNKHGFERWYWEPCDDGTVHEEGHYKNYVEHGIFREWNTNGRFRRGFPQYFVDGVKVTKRQYIAASKRDNTLPPYRDEDNDFHRTPLQGQFDGAIKGYEPKETTTSEFYNDAEARPGARRAVLAERARCHTIPGHYLSGVLGRLALR